MSLSINTLFGGFGSSTGNSFGSSLYTSLSELSSIRSGAYKKLLTAYYSQDKSSSSSVKSVTNKTNTVSRTEAKQLSEVKDAADELYESASKLTDTSSKGLFKKADSVTDDIVSAVKDYVKDYNSLIEEAADTSNTKVSGKVSFMTNQTNAYKNALSKVGITINADKTLSVDEKLFKKADISDVKSLFNGSSSMAYQSFVRASAISSAAENANNSALYGANGTYNSYYSSAYNWYL